MATEKFVKNKKIVLVIIAFFFGYLIIKEYFALNVVGIDFQSRFIFNGMWLNFSVLGMIMVFSLFWYILGKKFKLYSYEFKYIYPIVASEGICFILLKSISLEYAKLGNDIFEAISYALYKAGVVIVLWWNVISASHLSKFKLPEDSILQGFVVLGIIAFFVAILFLCAKVSPIIAVVICTMIMNFGIGMICSFDSAFVFLVATPIFVGFVFYTWIEKGELEEKTKNNDDNGIDIKALFQIEKEEFKLLGISLVALLVTYFLGFFENWNDVFSYIFAAVLSTDYNDLTTDNMLYEDGNYVMVFIIGAAVSAVLGEKLDKKLKYDSIVTELTKIIGRFIIQLTIAGVATDWVKNFIYSPFSFENPFTTGINDYVIGLESKIPDGLLVVVFLLSKILILAVNGIHLLLLVGAIFSLFVYGIQCAASIFTCNLIFIVLQMNNINVATWPPIVLTLFLLVVTQFLSGTVALDEPIEKVAE